MGILLIPRFGTRRGIKSISISCFGTITMRFYVGDLEQMARISVLMFL